MELLIKELDNLIKRFEVYSFEDKITLFKNAYYEDKELAIYFSCVPCIAIRYILPSMKEIEKKSETQEEVIESVETTISVVEDSINNRQKKR